MKEANARLNEEAGSNEDLLKDLIGQDQTQFDGEQGVVEDGIDVDL